MKNLFLMVLATALCTFTLTACSKNSSSQSAEPTTTKTQHTTETNNSPSPTSIIQPHNFDAPLLEKLVSQEINKLRQKRRAVALKHDNLLRQAADEQTTYVRKKGKLSHTQNNRQKEGVGDRVQYFGGKYKMVGENLQFLGFSIETITQGRKKTQNIIRPTYAEAAKKIAENWRKSKGHYHNLMEKDYVRVGTSVQIDGRKNGIYVTQVYGTNPIR